MKEKPANSVGQNLLLILEVSRGCILLQKTLPRPFSRAVLNVLLRHLLSGLRGAWQALKDTAKYET